MALVVLSVVEQRLDAVRAVLAGASVVEVALACGVSRQSVHTWLSRYLVEGVPGLADRSHRPMSCPHQAPPAVEAEVAEMRRAHPRWGAKRIRMELLRRYPGGTTAAGVVVPSERTINRVLARHGLLAERPRKKPRSAFRRFEREAPMQLWQIDIVEGVQLLDPVTGVLSEAKVVTGVDDHSRYCVMATVVRQATARAVCLAFAQALQRFGVPEEIITDNGKQFTDRFGKGGEVLFAKICRRNGITHRPTAPASPNQNGKVERFHGTLRPEFLDVAGPFTSIEEAQAELDGWVGDYNTDRPHQALDDQVPVMPADRFAPVSDQQRSLIDLWLPPTIAPTTTVAEPAVELNEAVEPVTVRAPVDASAGAWSAAWSGGAVEFDRVVPASGNLCVAQQQFLARPGAGRDDHPVLGRHRRDPPDDSWRRQDQVAAVPLDRTRPARLFAGGAVNAGPPPLPTTDGDSAAGGVVEVDRIVSRAGTIALAGRVLLAAEILAGRQVGVRIEPATLMFFDPDTRELLRVRPNPLTPDQVRRLRGARPAGPPPRPSTEPVRVQRRASNSGIVMVAGQKIALGREHAHQSVTITVSETTLAIELEDGDTRVIRRTTDQAIRSIKEQRRPAPA